MVAGIKTGDDSRNRQVYNVACIPHGFSYPCPSETQNTLFSSLGKSVSVHRMKDKQRENPSCIFTLVLVT
jgi:hypothetical protein